MRIERLHYTQTNAKVEIRGKVRRKASLAAENRGQNSQAKEHIPNK